MDDILNAFGRAARRNFAAALLQVKTQGATKLIQQSQVALDRMFDDVSTGGQPLTQDQLWKAVVFSVDDLAKLIKQFDEDKDGKLSREEFKELMEAAMAAGVQGRANISFNILVIRGKDLLAMDLNGKSDPYVKIFFNGNLLATSPVIKKTLTPEWNFSFSIKMEAAQKPLHYIKLELWDKDLISKDDAMGDCHLLFDLVSESEYSAERVWLPVNQGTDNGGSVQVSYTIKKV